MEKILSKINNILSLNSSAKDDVLVNLIRIGVGLTIVLFYSSPPRSRGIFDFFSQIPRYTFSNIESYIFSGFYEPFSLFLKIPVLEFHYFAYLDILLFFFGILLCVGFGTYYVTRILFVGFMYQILLSSYFSDHYFLLLTVVIGILLFANCSQLYGLDRYVSVTSHNKQPEPPVSILVQFKILVSAVYFYAFYGKFLNPSWRNGDIIQYYESFRILNFGYLSDLVNLVPNIVISWGILCVLLFLSFGFWFLKTRKLSMVLGLCFHMIIGLMMGIWVFGLMMVVLYLSFVSDPCTKKIKL